jgi:hypothetical protein
LQSEDEVVVGSLKIRLPEFATPWYYLRSIFKQILQPKTFHYSH